MIQTLKNAWKIADLRKKLLFTLMIVVLYRIGAVIPVPFVSADMLNAYQTMYGSSIFTYLNILSGNAFSQATLFALGIQPYITSSIVMQLLTISIPALERLQKDGGEEGKKKITQITRYVTVALGLITSYGYYVMLKNQGALINSTAFIGVVIIACYCAGSALVMWLAEKVNENGIGNGISLILFANIISRGPSMVGGIINMIAPYAEAGGRTFSVKGTILAVLSIVIGLAMVAFIVFMTNSERRLPVQYAKKVVGRKMYGGQSSNLPIKLNMSGVMPIIFGNSILSIVPTIAVFTPPAAEGSFWAGFQKFFSADSWFYAVAFFALIIAFSYFYIAISFNPIEVANNLKKNGGFIPGIRPGKPTSDYISKVLSRIILIGALFLGVIAVFPIIANIISKGAMAGLAFGGSSIIIIVGVVLETAREIEAQMTMRHYKGFLE